MRHGNRGGVNHAPVVFKKHGTPERKAVMEVKKMECLDCGWSGHKSELVRVNFTMGDPQPCCPACGGDRIQEEQSVSEK